MQTIIGRTVLVLALLCAAPRDDQAKDKLIPLNKQGTVLQDTAGKRLILKSQVVLREGMLEMLACLSGTKEHESILAVPAKAQTVHAGLLALGAESGEPVQFTPDFHPPTGQRIEIFLNWVDEDGKAHRVRAQTWVRNATRRYFVEKLARLPPEVEFPKDKNLKYDEKHGEMLWFGSMTKEDRDQFLGLSKDKAFQKVIQTFFDKTQMQEMKADWVFAGSGFYKDEKTGEEFYQAEGGDLICVANFASSVLDLSAESSATNDGLMFEAYTERIPPVGTDVEIELIPVFAKLKAKAPPKK